MTGRLHTKWLSWSAYAGMFVFGIVMALLGAVLPILSERLHFDLAQAGDLFLAMNFAMLLSMLAIGPAMDRFGKKPVLTLGALFACVALLLVATAAGYRTLMLSVMLLGAGGGALNGGANTLVADLHSDAREKSSALNILGIFFGFGALFQPFLLGALLERLGFQPILFLTLVLSLVPLVLYVALAFPPPKRGPALQLAEVGRLARHPLVLLLGFLLFFESGNEFVVGGYTSTYLTHELNTSVRTASYLLALYWACVMVGRVISSRLVLRIQGRTLVLASALLSAFGLSLMLLASREPVAAAGAAFIGFGVASIYPVTLGLAGSRFEAHSGTVFGILFSIALAGGMIMPWGVGQIAASHSLRSALILSVIGWLAIFVLQLLISRSANAATES